MLPKIVSAVSSDRDLILDLLHQKIQNVLQFECVDAKITDLRKWIYSSSMISSQRNDISIILWNADDLSLESQSVLLKPLEEVSENVNIFLIVRNENMMLPTILSRCVSLKLKTDIEKLNNYWDKISICWKSGPASCISFVDDLEKDEYLSVITEVIEKMRSGIRTEVNNKRLLVLQKALNAYDEILNTNINGKLVMDNFIISSWRAIKS